MRLSIDKLPTRVNLDARGIDIPSVLCPICGECTESASHLFFECSFVTQVYNRFERWWDFHLLGMRCYQQWLDWFLDLWLTKVRKQLLEATFLSLWWHVWCHRNACMFGKVRPKNNLFFDKFVTYSFVWVNSRCRSKNSSWVGWLLSIQKVGVLVSVSIGS